MNKHKTSHLFDLRSRSSMSFSSRNLITFKYSCSTKESYLYLMVGKKYGSAVKRNQLKRWIRILYKQLAGPFSTLGLMVRPMRKNLSFAETKLCFDLLNKKLKTHQ